MTSTPDLPDLDMYSRSWLLSLFRNWSPLVVTIAVFFVFGAIAIVGALLSGSLGSLNDWRLPADGVSAIRVVCFGMVASDSDASFPLIRDYPSTFRLAAIAATVGLVLHQWNLVANCPDQLAKSGVLRSRSNFRCSVWRSLC